MGVFKFCESFNFSIELQQIEDEFVGLCGSSTAMMNAEQFSSFLVQLGFIPDLCQQCFKYVLSRVDRPFHQIEGPFHQMYPSIR